MIPQRNLSLIANALRAANGRRIPDAVIERDYCLAWFLVGLSGHAFRDVLAFKGGTALRRCYFSDYRFSEDLDFTLMQSVDFAAIRKALDEIFAAVEKDSGIRMTFDREDKNSHQNSHTFYVRYQGPLPTPNDVKVDITIKEQVCFGLAEVPILKPYEGYADLPEDRTIKAYDLREIAIEKLTALTDKARNEPRDLYDLWYLLTHADLSFEILHSELEAKLRFRDRRLAALADALAAKRDRLNRLWTTRLSHQMIELPGFDDVYRTVHRAVRDARLKGE
jgi:predicted nucleotidyltransferase component of viral defense system